MARPRDHRIPSCAPTVISGILLRRDVGPSLAIEYDRRRCHHLLRITVTGISRRNYHPTINCKGLATPLPASPFCLPPAAMVCGARHLRSHQTSEGQTGQAPPDRNADHSY